MIKSMTGYGLGSFSSPDLEIRIEIKSLNSKFADINVRSPRALSEKELEIRNRVTKKLQRGKVNVNIDLQLLGKAEPAQQYNEALFIQYYSQLRRLADKVIASDGDLFRLALTSPDVILTKTEDHLDPDVWEHVLQTLNESVDKCDSFRKDEGISIEKQLVNAVDEIEGALSDIAKIDPDRTAKIKERIRNNLSEVVEEEQMDKNRLEQEIIFYIEKLDISEEKSRLQNHIEYFKETIGQNESQGKKLNFIAQEMGREINTIGSKANDAAIQKKVVMMKDELEKIKEQVLNVL
jgi:uncharacterized protein (TIGR00255 family)